jgi:hypothetical protein
MFDVLDLSFSVRYRYSLVIAAVALSNEEARENAAKSRPWGKKNRQWWIHYLTFKRLPLSYSKRDFDRKSSSAQSEGSFKLFFHVCHDILLDLWYEKESSSRVNNFRCYSLLVQGSYDHVLPPPEAKGS